MSIFCFRPTPVEELTPGGTRIKREQESRSGEDSYSLKKKRSGTRLPTDTVSKPTLYQAVANGSKSFEWQAMGVYDEEDLMEVTKTNICVQQEINYVFARCL